MTCSLRHNISHAILSAAYKDEYIPEDRLTQIEDAEMTISRLAQSGDSLEEYLDAVNGNDPELLDALKLIDKRIQERRAAYQNFSEEPPKSDFFEAERRRVAEIGLEDLYTIGDHANARK